MCTGFCVITWQNLKCALVSTQNKQSALMWALQHAKFQFAHTAQSCDFLVQPGREKKWREKATADVICRFGFVNIHGESGCVKVQPADCISNSTAYLCSCSTFCYVNSVFLHRYKKYWSYIKGPVFSKMFF